MRLVAAVLGTALVLLPAAALAQDETSTLCVTVGGATPDTGWDAISLQQAIVEGSASVSLVTDAGSCAAPAASLEPAADAPLPVEVVESGFSYEGGDLHWVAIVRNPNPSRWIAQYMGVQISGLDASGGLVDSDDDNVTLLPGQTSAVVGSMSDVKGIKSIEVQLANGESDWQEIDYATGNLTFDQLKVKPSDFSVSINGRATSTFDEQQENVSVIVVYRKGGELIGGDYAYVDFIPANGSAVFKIYSDFEKLPKGVNVEAYFEL